MYKYYHREHIEEEMTLIAVMMIMISSVHDAVLETTAITTTINRKQMDLVDMV